MSLFIVGLDITVVNVARPAIRRDLRVGVSGPAWTLDAYTVVMASLLCAPARRPTASGAGARRWRARRRHPGDAPASLEALGSDDLQALRRILGRCSDAARR